MSSSRLVRIRYRQLPDDVLAQASVTDHGSVVINIRPDLSVKARCSVIRQALRATQSDSETLRNPAGVVIPAGFLESVSDDPTSADGQPS